MIAHREALTKNTNLPLRAALDSRLSHERRKSPVKTKSKNDGDSSHDGTSEAQPCGGKAATGAAGVERSDRSEKKVDARESAASTSLASSARSARRSGHSSRPGYTGGARSSAGGHFRGLKEEGGTGRRASSVSARTSVVPTSTKRVEGGFRPAALRGYGQNRTRHAWGDESGLGTSAKATSKMKSDDGVGGDGAYSDASRESSNHKPASSGGRPVSVEPGSIDSTPLKRPWLRCVAVDKRPGEKSCLPPEKQATSDHSARRSTPSRFQSRSVERARTQEGAKRKRTTPYAENGYFTGRELEDEDHQPDMPVDNNNIPVPYAPYQQNVVDSYSFCAGTGLRRGDSANGGGSVGYVNEPTARFHGVDEIGNTYPIYRESPASGMGGTGNPSHGLPPPSPGVQNKTLHRVILHRHSQGTGTTTAHSRGVEVNVFGREREFSATDRDACSALQHMASPQSVGYGGFTTGSAAFGKDPHLERRGLPSPSYVAAPAAAAATMFPMGDYFTFGGVKHEIRPTSPIFKT